MMISPGTLSIIIVVLSLSHVTDSFIHSMRLIKKVNCFKELAVSVGSCIQRKLTIFSVHPHCKDVEGDIHQDQYTPCPTLLADCQVEQWNELCEDVDKIMEGLVSPAPESFRVLHSVMSKINFDESVPADDNDTNYLGDLKALSSFLVKPNYDIELYTDSEILKWRLIPRSNNKVGVIYPCDCIQEGKTELYHEHNSLNLSRMALDLATKTPSDPHVLPKIHDIVRQAEKRLVLTMGSDLRGPISSVACFNFALAGVQRSSSLFQTLSYIGIHELKRTGLRVSTQPKHILHMVEKFAACDIHGRHASDLYHIAGVCLEKKGYSDSMLIESLKDGDFGFHSPRPLIWLWRFSSRQKKVSISEFTSNSKDKRNVDWAEIFYDASKPLVVDVGSGMGASLLNLSNMTSCDDSADDSFNSGGDAFQMSWPDFNYAGADLNQAMVNFGNGIISRDTTARRMGRVHFLSLSAEDFLAELQSYPGGLALIMINFPSPYRLEVSGAGNSQLPSKHSNQFMVTKKVLALVAGLLSKPDRKGGNGLFLFQTKCEDVAVHVKNDCLSSGTMECVPCKNPIKDINLQYKSGNRPKRVDEWLKATPSAERAEGSMYSRTPFLPTAGRPETEVQCSYENTVVHRCLFRQKTS
mmetsp:Transcript_8279/g.18543  ORF Transcript_8279/g.18543 Transcript_8279/m.18543 type:complete len:638 (-) Transcript_8279:135-2048(-)